MAAATGLAGCANSGQRSDCSDGIDNDGDGVIDSADPGCTFNGNIEAPDPDFAACEDGTDNDSDGLIDFPDDPGCTGPADDDEYDDGIPACRDGIDNDGDGLIDYPNDPGCFYALENDEGDDCPDGPACPRCANGIDDDGDGLADYPEDPGCDQAGDDEEFNPEPNECGANVMLLPMPSQNEATGTATAGGNNELISACGGAGQETVYTIVIDEPRNLVVTTDFAETTLDTVVYLRGDCRDTDTELVCNDDSPDNESSTLSVDVQPGTYYLIVDAHSAGSAGDFKLQITEYIPQGEECDPAMPQCAPGLECRYLDGDATVTTCELPECQDGLDNDGDGLADYPDEPGCTDPDDNDEQDSCPGPDCPACGNQTDDDGDGATDFPDDPGCDAASDASEIDECIPGVEVIPLTDAGAAGTTMGTNDFNGNCDSFTSAEDVYAYKLDRDLASLSFSTVGSALDTVTYVRYGDCADAATEVACADPGTGGEVVTVDTPQQGFYYVFVDGDFSTGNYVLDVSGVIPGGGACDPAEDNFVCASGFYCNAGSLTCEATQCADGVDNDDPADGLSDWPADPGCASPSDNDESDDCPSGPGCPACSNEIDDDGDGKIDYDGAMPDIGCESAGDDDEQDCAGESDPVETVTMATHTGTTAGLADDFVPSCNSTNSAPDKVYVLPVIGELETLVIDTIGSAFDTVLYVRAPTCADPDLTCADGVPGGSLTPSEVTLNNVAPGSYLILIDGWGSSSGAYTLNVHGVIKEGEACDADLVASGAFECASGNVCASGICQPAACANGADDDGDGNSDWPDDPGCASSSDDDEADLCPSDPSCPACSNGLDDDGDGVTDYPDEPGCDAAGDDSELDCTDSDGIEPIDQATETGSTTGGTNDWVPSCSMTSTAPDAVRSISFPGQLSTLTVDTNTSNFDTVLFMKEGICTNTDLACDDDSGDGSQSLITLSAVAAGTYFIFIDAFSANSGNYVLNISGEVASGQACDPDQVAAGIVACPTGESCTDTGAGYLCQ